MLLLDLLPASFILNSWNCNSVIQGKYVNRLRISGRNSAQWRCLCQTSSQDDVCVDIERLSKNTRRIVASISIGTSLQAVWGVLTDYEGLADFIPGLASSQIIERTSTGARLLQVGEQNLAMGLKFRAKGVVEVDQGPKLQNEDGSYGRDINFDMVEGDFRIFKGTWRMEQEATVSGEDVTTMLWYILVVQPMAWLPVGLVEGRLTSEVRTNLLCVRDRAVSLCSAAQMKEMSNAFTSERERDQT